MDCRVALAERVEESLADGGPWPVPEGWAWVPLKRLSSFIGRGRGPTYVDSNGVPVVNQKCIRWRRLEAKHFKQTARSAFVRLAPELHLQAGDLLWNSTGTGTIGRALVYDGSFPELTIDSHVTLVRPVSVLPAYLGYFIETTRVQRLVVDSHVGSTNQRELPRSFVEDLLIPLPPLAEQRRIVARIDALFAEIAEGEAALVAARSGLDTFRRALLKAAVTGELTKDWRAAHTGSETGRDLLARITQEPAVGSRSKGGGRRSAGQSPDIALPELPSSWAWAKIDDILVRIEAGLNVSAEGRPPADGETGIVKISAVTWGEFDESASKVLPRTASVDPNHLIQVGDFLFSRANTLELVGAPVIVKSISKRLVLSDKVLRFRLSPGMDRWLEIVLKSALGRKQIENRATGAQLSMRNISQDSIRAISVPIPPMEEMAEILRRVSEATSAASDTLTVLDAEAADAARLKQSILKAAFEGRLVPQDSTEEPAAALLERLATTAPAPARAKRGRGARSHA